MTKQLYILLILLMSLSLLGIIGLQVYYINQSIKVKEDQFSQSVLQTLGMVCSDIQAQDMRNFVDRYKNPAKNIGFKTSTSELFNPNKKGSSNRSFSSSDRVIFNPEFPSIQFVISKDDSVKAFFWSALTEHLDREYAKKDNQYKKSEEVSDSISTFELAILQDKYLIYGDRISIGKRIDKAQLEQMLKKNFALRNINTPFEYAIFDRNVITPIYSRNFVRSGNEYISTLFFDSDGKIQYQIYVDFPLRRDFVLSSMWLILLLSFVFTLIIIFAYAGALYLIFKHKKSSEVKTDFINNMSHELKTPIATINLSIDALLNPKTLQSQDRVVQYANIIKDENKRMYNQIENVLRISRLDKDLMASNLKEYSINNIVSEASNRIRLLVENRGGGLNLKLNASKDIARIDDLLFANAISNILDNAVKYSNQKPLIDVCTENISNFIEIRIKDNGIGIPKGEQKRIFEKFYRVSTGNVHNIKGQGLGLAYVKQILDAHNAEIKLESTVGKGSIFTIRVPLL